MKKLLFSTMLFAAIAFSGAAFADEVVEYGAPITVTHRTYTVVQPGYYYYTGHRCYTKERPDIGVNFLGLSAGVGSEHSRIYCYPYP